jgi:hypothetical protein
MIKPRGQGNPKTAIGIPLGEGLDFDADEAAVFLTPGAARAPAVRTNGDPVTVVAQTGTSVAMIEKTCFKIIPPGRVHAKWIASCIQLSRRGLAELPAREHPV